VRIVEVTIVRKQVELTIEELHYYGLLTTQFRLLVKGRRCFYCGIETPKLADRTSDHLFPRSLGGGKNRLGGMTVNACRPCNTAKGSMLPEAFRALRYSGKPIEFFGERIVHASFPRESAAATSTSAATIQPSRTP
jgi:hypothetical protein